MDWQLIDFLERGLALSQNEDMWYVGLTGSVMRIDRHCVAILTFIR